MSEDSGIAAGAAFGGVITSKVNGPGYAFTEEQLRALETKWEDLADKFRDGRVNAQRIANAKGPGAEYASEDNAQLVRQSGQTLLETLIARENFCHDQLEKIRAAMGSYANAEDDATADVKTQEGKF